MGEKQPATALLNSSSDRCAGCSKFGETEKKDAGGESWAFKKGDVLDRRDRRWLARLSPIRVEAELGLKSWGPNSI